MARMISLASQTYPAGTYGPFSIDALLNNKPDYLVLTLTVEGWPDAAPLITGNLLWNTGDGAPFTISSPVLARDGTLKSSTTVGVGVPKDAAGKVAVTGATLTMTAMQSLRTAVTLATQSVR